MGGIQVTLKAGTKKELEQKAREWLRDRREQGWDIRAGWDPTEAEEKEDGLWKITLSGHT